MLERVSERLDLWYSQRERDLDTFSRSETVIGSLSPTSRAQADAHRYLAYVQEGFPQYQALFVLDAAGAPRVWVGAQPALPPTLLASLARTEKTRTGGVHRVGGERVQFVSAPLTGVDGRQGSLHAMIGIDAVQAMIPGDDSRVGRVAALTDTGEVVAQSSARRARDGADAGRRRAGVRRQERRALGRQRAPLRALRLDPGGGGALRGGLSRPWSP